MRDIQHTRSYGVFFSTVIGAYIVVIAITPVVRCYVAQYSLLRTAQRALHFDSLADLFNQTPSQLLWQASSFAEINARRLLVQI